MNKRTTVIVDNPSSLKKAFEIIDNYFEEAICGLSLSLMASCIMVQVVFRLFSAAAPWAEEIAVYCMISAVYFGCSMAIKEHAHIRINLVVKRLPRPLMISAVILSDILWMSFIVFLFIESLVFIELLFDTVFISPALEIDQKWPHLIVPVCLVLMMIRLLQVYYKCYKNNNWESLL